MTTEFHAFEAADGQTVDAELGRLGVPENRNSRHSREIELAFVRFKSTAKQPGPPVIYLAGGPGGSGIATARSSRFPLFMAMREAGDVIALDQRAIGLSKPNLDCNECLDYPLDRPARRDEMLHLFRQKFGACARRLSEQGADLAAYNTCENADDVEALRQALGVEKISLWSTSYGTHLALAVIRRHERGVNRTVLAGVEGPDHTLKLPSGIRRHWQEIAHLCRSDPAVGPRVPDLMGLVETVGARLEQQPVTTKIIDPRTGQPVPVTVGRFDLQLYMATSTGRIDAIRAFPAAVHAMARGDYEALARFALEFRRMPLGSAMSWVMDCASGASEERRARSRQEEAEFPIGGLSDFPFPHVCDSWGNPDLGPAFRVPVRSDVPILFMSGALDGRTPAGNVEEIQTGFPNSTHVVIEDTAHGDHLLLSSPETGAAMVKFLKGEPVSSGRIALPPLRFEPVAVSTATGS